MVVEAPLMNGSAHKHMDSTPGPIVTASELPMRGKRGSIKRTLKGDGATVLTQNSTYTVRQLPSTPRELQRDGLEYRGRLARAGTHLALAVTREQAFVWDYTAHTAISNARVFDVPFPTKQGDPVPFGALVFDGASTDVGMVLISAAMPWKVVFFDSIERAASIGLFQERKAGVDGTLVGIFAGETIIEITSADHAGFILTLSSGRVAQLTLRDGQGKPKISSQILRASEPSAAGIFGSIKGLLTPNWKRATTVRTRTLGTRGQVQAVALTDKAEMLVWDLDWSDRHEYKGSIDFREVIVEELQKMESPETQGSAESITTLDFAFADNSSQDRKQEVALLGAEQPLEVWVLVSSGSGGARQYTLFEMELTRHEVAKVRAIVLESYQIHDSSKQQIKPRVLLPKPGHTGYVAFGDAVVLFATANTIEDGPERQLHDDSYVAPIPFQDAVFVRSDKDVTIFGIEVEESRNNKDASCIAFFQGVGLVRFNAVDPTGDVERSRPSVKSKIEQAVFYGLLQDNVLDFSRKGDELYSIEEVEAAALAISHEILCSKSPFIPIPPAAVENHLAFRARALRALATHLLHAYPVLSKATMWQLFWDAEKVAAGQEMFQAFEEPKATSGRGSRGLYETCSYASSKPEFSFVGDATGQDLVYNLFIGGLDSLDTFLPVARELVEQMVRDSGKEVKEQYVRVIAELVDLWVRTMNTIFAFRAEHAALYGVKPDAIIDGILASPADYKGLPEFWTSRPLMIKSILKIIGASREFATEIYEKPADDSQDSLLGDCLKKMVLDVANLVQIWCLMYQERIDWLSSHETHRQLDEARRLEGAFLKLRRNQFQGLVPIGQSKFAIQLAEKYKDMHALTELNVGESQWFLELKESSQSPEEKVACMEELQAVLNRIGRYFDRFGDEWANAFFDEAFAGNRAGTMLHEAQEKWGPALTRYLRADNSRAKICWIDDIIAGDDYLHASAALIDAATERETQLWSKKVELSMSKLALMADQEGSTGVREVDDTTATKPSRNLEIVTMQERLYAHILPELMHALDRETEVQVVQNKFARRTASPAHRQLLVSGLSRLVNHEALEVDELIDVFTLMDTVVDYSDERNLQSSEIECALRTLNAAAPDMDGSHFEMLNALIWKRCYLQDDWHAVTAKNRRGRTPIVRDEDIHTLGHTATWRSIFYFYDSGLLEGPDRYVRFLTPSECLGAACRPEHLSSRFADDALLDPILQDNRLEDEQLKGLVEDDNLDDWAKTIAHEVMDELAAAAERKANQLARARELLDQQSEEEYEGDEMVPNGHGNGHLLDAIKMEVEEDVMME